MKVEVGMKFGRLTVLEKTTKQQRNKGCISGFSNLAASKCKCECNNIILVLDNHLKTGHTKSCGCYKLDAVKCKVKTHGLSKKKGYHSWQAMIQRCTNPKRERYPLYGGRGITFAKKWETFEGFWEDMGSTWQKGLSLERIDSNGNYCKENCKWSSNKEQANNTRTNILWLYEGNWISTDELASKLNIKRNSLFAPYYYKKYPRKKLYEGG